MTWLGLWLAGGYMLAVSVLYVAAPSLWIDPFRGDNDPARWQPIAETVALLLCHGGTCAPRDVSRAIADR
jgi:hypothetical protein